ncbi:glycosyl hydrolase family 114 [Murinocardiopsis flavida]|uniref:Glycosyl hydrolase family 114 n=1 Tax=Murinocardiopsis flavida TaxID=645275 RepID=A0A2P8DFA0_9ACTN|nr:glycosyl hydrolase family 114 [Murinocardiopsis flavida]
MAVAVALCLAGCSAGDPAGQGRPPVPEGVGFDYQIGGASTPDSDVGLVVRDRAAEPAPGVYSVCYVNGYQAQESEIGFWRADHADLLLTDDDGGPVVDTDWNEQLLDISTGSKRAAVAAVVGGWIAGCAKDGFDAVEIDNLDSPTRSHGLLTSDDALAYAGELIERAHGAGLAIGQKNAVAAAGRGARAGFDFAVAEECARYDECGDYAGAYPGRVYDVEYRKGDFDRACAHPVPGVSVVLRDLGVTPPGDDAHVRAVCP